MRTLNHLTFGLGNGKARVWLLYEQKYTPEPTTAWEWSPVWEWSPAAQPTDVRSYIMSCSDTFPKRTTPRWLFAYGAFAPGQYLGPKSKLPLRRHHTRVRITTYLPMGPVQPGTLLPFDAALELWFTHVDFLLTGGNDEQA